MSTIISDHNDPRIKKFLGLKGTNKDTLVIGEGFKVVEKMNSTLGCNEILTSDKIYDSYPEFFSNFDCEIYLADESFISNHVGYKFHQGLFGITDHPGYMDLAKISGESLILNNLDNAENVGALIRSALGLGFNNIIIDSQSCSPYLKRAIRVSMGNVFFANIFKVDNLVESIEQLKGMGYNVLSGANEEGSVNFKDVKIIDGKVAIIIGNEGHGIAEDVKRASSSIVKIPVKKEVEHLNAAAAGAILMSFFSPL